MKGEFNMSSTNKTTNYNLSQFVGTDVPSYLGDYNGDMSKIDKAIGDVANSQGSVEQSVSGLTSEVQGLSAQVSGVATSVQQVQTSVAQIDSAYKQADTALSQRITANANNIQTNTTAIEGINTAIGTEDISEIGDGTIKGAISNINSSLETKAITHTFINNDEYNWATYEDESIKMNDLAFINFRLQTNSQNNYTHNVEYNVLQLSEKPSHNIFCVANLVNNAGDEAVGVVINTNGILSIAFSKDITNYTFALDIFGFFKCV